MGSTQDILLTKRYLRSWNSYYQALKHSFYPQKSYCKGLALPSEHLPPLRRLGVFSFRRYFL